jgi:hypothetical protein
MNIRNGQFNHPGERISALLLAVAATILVFAAINAGFTPHATDLAGRVLGQSSMIL